MSLVSSVASNQFVSYLQDHCFQGNQDIPETILEYTTGKPYEYLLKNIVTHKRSNASDQFLNYLFQAILLKKSSLTSTLKLDDLRDPDQLRTHLLPLRDDRAILSKRLTRNEHSKLRVDIIYVLNTLNSIYPINQEDPIMMEDIAEDDLFTTLSGHRFSLTHFLNYHEERAYRGSKGEQHNNKFFLNPLTNHFFSFEETHRLILEALRKRKKIVHLHTRLLSPPGMRPPYIQQRSLHELYLSKKKQYKQNQALIAQIKNSHPELFNR